MSRARMTYEQAAAKRERDRILTENQKRICDQHEPNMSDYHKRFAWLPDVINYGGCGPDFGRVIWFRTYYEKGNDAMTRATFEEHRRKRKWLLDYDVIWRARARGEDV